MILCSGHRFAEEVQVWFVFLCLSLGPLRISAASVLKCQLNAENAEIRRGRRENRTAKRKDAKKSRQEIRQVFFTALCEKPYSRISGGQELWLNNRHLFSVLINRDIDHFRLGHAHAFALSESFNFDHNANCD